MWEEIDFEHGRISTFQGLVTLTLDRVILHTVMHHLSTITYMPNFNEIEETFCRRTDGHLRLVGVDPNIHNKLGLTDGRICATDGPCRLESHVMQKLGQI